MSSLVVDAAARTIAGLAVPYGVTATVIGRRQQRFVRGSLTWSDVAHVKLLIRHDNSQIVGKAVELVDTDRGLSARFRVAYGAAGDRALALAASTHSGLSVGLGLDAKFRDHDGVQECERGVLVEVSLTPDPAFRQEGLS